MDRTGGAAAAAAAAVFWLLAVGSLPIFPLGSQQKGTFLMFFLHEKQYI